MIEVCFHSILEMPKAGAKILDVGCRVFGFAKPMLLAGTRVVAVEPDPTIQPIKHDNLALIQVALTCEAKDNTTEKLICWSYGEGNHLESIPGSKPKDATFHEVTCMSLPHLMEHVGVEYWDIVKLDCEGAEYEILPEWPGPIAGQITVEFHEHTGCSPPKGYPALLNHLKQWYEPVKFKKESLGTGRSQLNYWDTLFVLKELL